MTLTIPALEAGAHVVFLAVGEEKAAAARRAFADEPSHSDAGEPDPLATRTTTVILDEAAAALLV